MAWFAKIETGIVDKPTFDRFVPAHVQYVKDLIDKGYNARSGYWERRGGGMLLFEAQSREEAEAIVRDDPLIANNCVEYELFEWCLVAQP